MTPLELRLYSQGYADAQGDKYRLAIAQAYYTAMLERQKRIPPLESLTKHIDKKPVSKKKQSPEEMLAAVKIIDAAIKGRKHGNL